MKSRQTFSHRNLTAEAEVLAGAFALGGGLFFFVFVWVMSR